MVQLTNPLTQEAMVDHNGNHRCLIEKNVPMAFILTSRWQDGGESLWIERNGLCSNQSAV